LHPLLYYVYFYIHTYMHAQTHTQVTHWTSTTCLLLDLVCITRLAKGLAHFSSINRVFLCTIYWELPGFIFLRVNWQGFHHSAPSVCCLVPMSLLPQTFSLQITELITSTTRYKWPFALRVPKLGMLFHGFLCVKMYFLLSFASYVLYTIYIIARNLKKNFIPGWFYVMLSNDC